MSGDTQCQSCSMPIESGTLCQYCADEGGRLHPFEETFERFIQWVSRREPGLSREEAEIRTEQFMASMPAWADDPTLADRIAARGG